MLYGHKVYGAKFYSLIIYYTIGPFFFLVSFVVVEINMRHGDIDGNGQIHSG